MMDGPRWRQIVAILETTSPAEARWLADRLEAPWQRRRRRLDARDDAVRTAAAAICAGARPTVAAKTLAAAFDAYLASAWTRERGLEKLPDASTGRECLHRLAHLNGGGPLGWRQISNIIAGSR